MYLSSFFLASPAVIYTVLTSQNYCTVGMQVRASTPFGIDTVQNGVRPSACGVQHGAASTYHVGGHLQR